MKIYNLGSLNIDYVYQVPHFVRPGETLSSEKMEIFPGGKGLNQSAALGRAGAEVIHGGFIGQNDTWLSDILKSSHVDTNRIRLLSSSSGHAIIQVEPNGQNCIIIFPGANHCFTAEYVESVLADAAAGDILLLQNEINLLDVIFEIAHSKGMQIAFNPSPFDESLLRLPLSYVDWWICNEIEGNALTGKKAPKEIMDAMSERFPKANLLLTLGSEGCIFKNASLSVSQSAFKVKAVDTTAAGDTFTGYFLAMAASGKSIPEALKIASYASSIAVTRKGASSSIPGLREVMDGLGRLSPQAEQAAPQPTEYL